MSNIKKLILKTILVLKAKDNFSQDLIRWRNVYIDDKHISEVKFENLSDEELVKAYELILNNSNKIT